MLTFDLDFGEILAASGGRIVEEPAPAALEGQTPDVKDIFAKMRPFMVDVQDVDDSREAIYTRIEGE